MKRHIPFFSAQHLHHRVTSALAMTLTASAVLAGCAFDSAESEDFAETEEGVQALTTVRLHIVVTDRDGAPVPAANGATYTTLVNDLNQRYLHVGLKFLFNPSTDLEAVNSTLLNNDSTDSQPADEAIQNINAMARTRYAAEHAGKLVVFFRNTQYSNLSSGRANWVIMEQGSVVGKVMHELGHYFQLMHPFNGRSNANGPTRAEVVERIRAYVEDEGHPEADGLKALDAFDGDASYVDDTPTDLGDTIYIAEGINRCAGNGSLQFTVNFHNKSYGNNGTKTYTFVPNRTNPMSYFDTCNLNPTFTSDQRTIILNSLYHGNRMHLTRGAAWLDSYQDDLVTPAAVSRHADTVAVYATTQDGRPVSKVWDASRGGYWPNNNWSGLGGGGFESLSTLSRASSELFVFASKMGADNAVQKEWSDSVGQYLPSNDTWEGYPEYDDQVFGGITATSRSSSTYELFGRWVDGTIRARAWNGSGWTETEWVNLSGKGTSPPAAIRRAGSNVVNVFARWSDGTIQSTFWASPYTYASSGWVNLGGRGVDSPAVVSRRPDILDLFSRWDDGTIRSKVWTQARTQYQSGWWPGQTDWRNLGGSAASKPVAISRNAASIMLATRWVDGSVQYKVWDDSRGSWWPGNETWRSLGGQTEGAPVLVQRGDDIVVYARWVDGSVRTKVWSARTNQWSPSQTGWTSLGTP